MLHIEVGGINSLNATFYFMDYFCALQAMKTTVFWYLKHELHEAKQ